MSDDSGLLRVIRQTGLYAIGNAAIKMAGLILAPLYLNTAYLSTDAYGHLVLLEATAQILIPVAGMGLATGMLKFMSDPGDERPTEAVPFTTLLLSAALGAIVFGVVWLAAPALGAFLVDDATRVVLPRLMGGYAALKVVTTVPYMLLRVRERAGWYTIGVAAEWTVLVAGVYYFLAVRGMALEGVMIAYVASAAVSANVLTAFLLTQVAWRFDGRLVRDLLRFGVPLVLSAVAGLFLNVGDRYLLKWLTDAETVGVYGWAARLGGAVNMLFVQSFQLAFTVIGLKAVGAGDRSLHRRTFRHYTIWTGWAVLGLSLLSYDLTLFLTEAFGVDRYYLQSDVMVLPIALGFLGYGIYIVVNNILYATELTHVVGFNVLIAAGTNAVLNVALIPFLGAYGAAVATTMSYALLAALSARVAERQIRVGYPWRVVWISVTIIVVLWLAAYPTLEWDVGPRLAARVVLIVTYIPLIRVLGLYTREDVDKGIEAIRRRLS
ncbi:MAG: oligosaccharide flippase family protein [Rhodothermales bacterium]